MAMTEYLQKLLKRQGIFSEHDNEQIPREIRWKGQSLLTYRARSFGNISLLHCPTEHRYFVSQSAHRHRFIVEITADSDVLDLELEVFNDKGEPFLSSEFSDDEAEVVTYWIAEVFKVHTPKPDLTMLANYGRF